MTKIRLEKHRQLTLPAEMIEQAHLQYGDVLEVSYFNGVLMLTPIKQRGRPCIMGQITILRHDKGIFDYAARLRARQRMKIIDAVHLATALKAACRYFVTNDKAMRSTGALSVVQLSSLL